jgi:diaminohydroxyphosphoribosylaminopyrimidine deaminase/5-amino-6-(5-phosphoribosylamino)uracil reductase
MSPDIHTHELFMRRCLQIAANGLGAAAPNPMVGAVVVHCGTIAAEGYHRTCGGNHAEVEAIHKITNPDILKSSTLYVSLEPCCHWGKTPPCTDLIIKSGIPRVVVATQDPFHKVSGGGIATLQKYGISVLTGILEDEAQTLNRRFFTYHTQKRPYVILKWAQTTDGYIDKHRSPQAPPAVISNAAAHRLSHLWRTQEQAILVGTNAAAMDNPLLTARLCYGKNPLRAVVDARSRLPHELRIFNADAPTIVLPTRNPAEMLALLYQQHIQSVIVEGGLRLLQCFIDHNLWDEARIFTAPQRFAGGVAAPTITGTTILRTSIGDNVMEILRAR